MGWRDISTIDIFSFCKTWKSRQEIKDFFSLTNIESQHMCRWLGKLSDDVHIERNLGGTKKAILYKIKQETLEEMKIN